MKVEVPTRIVVSDPLVGVAMMVQDGKDKLLSPIESSSAAHVFEFSISVDLSSGLPNFLGRFAQGPRNARFVYVNSGTYAGASHSFWGRRAKISLMSITREQIKKAVAGRAVIETSFPGVGKDGGPTCASVRGIEWKVVGR